MITKDEHKIVSEHLIRLIDFDRVYNDCAPITKEKFTKESIINSVKRMIRSYPTFDNSVEGRIESLTSLFSTRNGTFNDYMYFVSGKNSSNESWWLTEKKFKSRIKFFKYAAMNYVCFDMKEHLRKYKIKELIDNVR